jgi:hypothetical protein
MDRHATTTGRSADVCEQRTRADALWARSAAGLREIARVRGHMMSLWDLLAEAQECAILTRERLAASHEPLPRRPSRALNMPASSESVQAAGPDP